MALVIDTVGNNTGPGSEAASGSFSFTNTAGTVLYIAVSGFRANRNVSSLTYNSVALTLVKKVGNSGGRWTEIWRLLSPATGSNTVAWALSGGSSGPTFGMVTFTGNHATTPEGATGSATGTSNSPSNAITTANDNSIVLDSIYVNNTNARTPGAGQTERWDIQDAALGSEGSAGSTEPKATAGSVTMSWSWATSTDWAHVQVEVREAATAPSTSIKSIQGVAQADIKSMEGVAIASIKSVAGVSNVS